MMRAMTARPVSARQILEDYAGMNLQRVLLTEEPAGHA
jgi:hypothetical protein